MTPDQVSIVRLTFIHVLLIKDEAGKIFYERLFAIAPETRAMFKGDIDAQGRKLMDTLATAISSLGDSEALAGLLAGLGQRHAGYGVTDAHYDLVGEALLWTLEKSLGHGFTPPVRDAWAALYASVAASMKAAAAGRVSAVA